MQGIERNYRAIGPAELAQLAGLTRLIPIPPYPRHYAVQARIPEHLHTLDWLAGWSIS